MHSPLLRRIKYKKRGGGRPIISYEQNSNAHGARSRRAKTQCGKHLSIIVYLSYKTGVIVRHGVISCCKERYFSPNAAPTCTNPKFPSFAENAAQKRRRTIFSDIYIPDDRNSPNQVLGLVTSQAT